MRERKQGRRYDRDEGNEERTCFAREKSNVRLLCYNEKNEDEMNK